MNIYIPANACMFVCMLQAFSSPSLVPNICKSPTSTTVNHGFWVVFIRGKDYKLNQFIDCRN